MITNTERGASWVDMRTELSGTRKEVEALRREIKTLCWMGWVIPDLAGFGARFVVAAAIWKIGGVRRTR